jgi:hypothetical protein
MILSSLLPSIHFFIFGESLVAGQIVCDFSLYWTQIHQLRFIHVLLYLSRKKGIRAIHLKEALFNIATKTTIFVEKNVITCNIAVTKYQ